MTVTNDLDQSQRKRMGILAIGLAVMGLIASLTSGRLLFGAVLLFGIDPATQRDAFARQLVYGTSGIGLMIFGLGFLYLCRKVWMLSKGHQVSF